MDEDKFSKLVLSRFSKDFNIYEQVWGVHEWTGARKRVDAVIRPKKTHLWKNQNIAFGIEFKKPDAYLDAKDVSKLIRQAYDYLHTDFEGFGKIPILVCPLKVQSVYCSENEMQFIRRVLGRFGIGEIQNRRGHIGLTIAFQDNYFIWSEERGIMNGKHCLLKF